MTKWEILNKEVLSSLFQIKGGELIWSKSGKVAGTIGNHGYRVVNLYAVFGKTTLVLAHQIVFLLHYGFLPSLIDHKDRNKLNNDPENLRESDVFNNSLNTGLQKNNTSGYKGVTYCKSTGKWRGRFCHKGVTHYIPRQSTAEEAYLLLEETKCQLIPNYEEIVFANS